MKVYKIFLFCFLLSIKNLSAQPTITSFQPTSGPVGTIVNIVGTNFSATADSNFVYFGAVRANINSASNNNLTVVVPAGASFQPLSVANHFLTAYSDKPFVVTFSKADSTFISSSFAQKLDLKSGFFPYDVAVSDFDNDGKPDIASVNLGENTVSIFRNTSQNGSISFASKLNLISGQSPESIAVGDLNGDGEPDIVVANSSATAQSVSVYINTSTVGNISFAPKIDYSTGVDYPSPSSVSISDLDNDGKPDLVATFALQDSISIFKNTSVNGIVSFAEKKNFYTYGSAYSVAITDLNGDNKPEIAIATESSAVSILRNTSVIDTISFDDPINFPVGAFSLKIASGDLDKDGKTDLIVSNYLSGNISVLRNVSTNATLSFAPQIVYNISGLPIGVCINDLDGNEKLDIAAVNYSNGVLVYKNECDIGNIFFDNGINYATESGVRSVTSCDLNGDGKPELITANDADSTVSILKNEISLVLAVSLLKFGCTNLKDKIQLEWETADEKDIDHFVIESSTNGSTFLPIGTVLTKGGNNVNQYNFFDNSPYNGENFYRLKIINKDGKIAYSQIISANINRNLTITIYPNPSHTGKINLDLKKKYENIILNIYDINGKLVYSKTAFEQQKFEIDLKGIPGVYNLLLNLNGEKNIYRFELLK